MGAPDNTPYGKEVDVALRTDSKGSGERGPQKLPSTPKSFWVMGAGAGEHPVTGLQVLLMIVACALPCALVIVVLSDVGYGLKVYNEVSTARMSRAGDVACAVAAAVLVLLYILDWFRWGSVVLQAIAAAATIALITVAAILKGRNYPWAPILFVVFLVPAMLGTLRTTLCKTTSRSPFHKAVSAILLTAGLVVIAIWVVWVVGGDHGWTRSTKDQLAGALPNVYKYMYSERELSYVDNCRPETKNNAAFSKDEQSDILSACQRAVTVWLMIYVSPLMCAISLIVAAIFAFVSGVVVKPHDHSNLVRAVKHFIVSLIFLFAGMYCSASFFSVQMTTAFMAFFAAALLVLLVWTLLELGTQNLEPLLTDSRFGKLMYQAFQSDWVKAIIVAVVNFFFPIYFLLNMMNQRIRKCRGTTDGCEGRFTKPATKALDEISRWHWQSVLTKVAVLSELFFTLQVGFTKATYVFLSWLVKELSTVDFGYVCLLVFAVGMVMFLLPPVPGVPVYVFAGIVISQVGSQQLGENGFIWGILAACGVSLLCKLLASLMQYLVGLSLGTKVKVQQLIKVDSVPTRAVEKILKRPGLDIAKVAILVGGPDWPTSVTCGILKLNIPQMLLGTVPVIILLAPCVLAGAFISKQGAPGEDNIYPVLAQFATLLAFAVQTAALLLAGLLTLNVIEECGEELSRERPEHAAVAELTAKEQHFNRLYAETASWKRLTILDKAMLVSMTIAHLISGIVFVLLSSVCFLPFSVDADIAAPVEEGGLGGNAWAIILVPGWIAIGIFAFGVFVHIVHLLIMSARTKAVMRRQLPCPE